MDSVVVVCLGEVVTFGDSSLTSSIVALLSIYSLVTTLASLIQEA